ncbi:MAG: TIGR01777 family oxidoreductase [Acidobacteriota bacterium]|nr:TIGR01777 family oxidoreductase [Acidobacteriota bacterium]
MRLCLTGGTGLIGQELYSVLEQDRHEIVALTRSPEKARRKLPSAHCITWDANSTLTSQPALEGLDGVIHLAGEPIAAGRWTARRKANIRDSRVVGTRNLVELLCQLQDPPRVLVSGSAIGYYGDRADERLEEDALPADDFLGQACREWEDEAQQATKCGIRVVQLRTGLVLSTRGGVLPQMLTPFKMFLGGPLASGQQWMSWIHIQDQVRAIQHVLFNQECTGPVNLTAPSPVTNGEFTKVLASVLKRPSIFRVPKSILILLLGELAETLLLRGQRVLPRKLQESGYEFKYPYLKEALLDLLN